MIELNYPYFKPAGDHALLAVFGDEIDLATNHRVHALDRLLQEEPFEGFIETVPTYTSILVYYNLLNIGYENVLLAVKEKVDRIGEEIELIPRKIEIPTVYGGECGPDIAHVAQHNHLSIKEVIRIHSSRDYPVYMMGFTPGFPYLGGMDESIAAPRLESPRTHVPAGSVGIAGKQTGIYPIDSPGGWQIIGRTALKLFDPKREPPFLLAPGDLVRFVPAQAQADKQQE
jgi:inhibitor of KinA